MPLGRQEVRLEWQAAPLGTPITAATVISGVSGWTDVRTTGVEITQTVTGFQPGAPYHWRARLLYRPGNALGLLGAHPLGQLERDRPARGQRVSYLPAACPE